MDEILRRLEVIEKRLSDLESRVSSQFGASAAAPATPPPPPLYVAEMFGARPPIAPPAGVMPAPLRPEPAPAALAGQAGASVESYIGRKVLAAIGILAVIVGASFFLKYAFENNLIGVTGRVVLGIISGLTFIIIGEFLRKKYPRYADFISGGGLALLYLSIYGAFWFYKLISQPAAFSFMAAITAFGVALALWADTVELAALAVIGGFLTPFLLSTGVAQDFNLFAYIAILGIGILSISFFKKWQPLTLIGFVATVINFSSWYGVYYAPEKLFFTIYVLVVLYAIYLLAGIVSNIATKVSANSGDLFIFTINPAWFFGWLYYLLKIVHPHYADSLGFIAAGLGALYILLAYIASFANSEDKRLTLFLGAVAVLFLTIAVPLQLKQSAITIAWAAEAAILFMLGSYLRNIGLRYFALAVLGLAIVRLFAFDSGAGDLSLFSPVFNKRFFTYFMTIAASGLTGYVALRSSPEAELSKDEKVAAGLLGTVVNVLMVIAVTLEIYTFFEARIFKLEQAEIEKLRRQTPVAERTTPFGNVQPQSYFDDYQARAQVQATAQYRSLTNQRNASISVFWTIYAVVLMTLGMLYRSALFRWSSLALFGVTIIKVFFFDLSVLKTPYRIISFMVLGIILLLASFLYYRYQKRLEVHPQP